MTIYDCSVLKEEDEEVVKDERGGGGESEVGRMG